MKNFIKILCILFVCLFGQHIKTSMSMEDAFKILNISEDATDDQVKKAFKRKAFQWHPDRWLRASEQEQEKAKIKFQEIDHARSIILNTREWIRENRHVLERITKSYWQEYANVTYQTVKDYILATPNLENRLHLGIIFTNHDYDKHAISTAIYNIQKQFEPQEQLRREQEERERQEQEERERQEQEERERQEQEERDRLQREHEEILRQQRANRPENKTMLCKALELAATLRHE